jgi:hypothetical protein
MTGEENLVRGVISLVDGEWQRIPESLCGAALHRNQTKARFLRLVEPTVGSRFHTSPVPLSPRAISRPPMNLNFLEIVGITFFVKLF